MRKLPRMDLSRLANYSPHLVILGAGASRAAAPSGDRNGKLLPVMADLVEVVGLADLLEASSISWRKRNFEALYDDLASNAPHASLVAELEARISRYFAELQLPDGANIYDYLLLCLREKDVIATFNWDPFLAQAYKRNASSRRLPHVLFLHGNVALGICLACRVKGYVGSRCAKCGQPFEATHLLYPVKNKDYTSDPFVSSEWSELRRCLEEAYLLTIFGYGAPETDAAAIQLMRDVWARNETRELAQIEIIDIRPEEDLLRTWEPFVIRDHYHAARRLSQTWMAMHPRRSCEAFAWATLQCDPWRDNRVPSFETVRELQHWMAPLIAEEDNQDSSGAPFSALPCEEIVRPAT